MKACPTVQGEARLCPSIARSSVQSTPCPRPCSTKPRLPKVCPRASLFPRNTSDQSARLKEISTQAAPCKASHTPRTSLRERAPESGTCPGPTGPNALRAAQSCAGAKPRPSDRRARLSKAFLAQASRLNKDPPSRGALTPQAPPRRSPSLQGRSAQAPPPHEVLLIGEAPSQGAPSPRPAYPRSTRAKNASRARLPLPKAPLLPSTAHPKQAPSTGSLSKGSPAKPGPPLPLRDPPRAPRSAQPTQGLRP